MLYYDAQKECQANRFAVYFLVSYEKIVVKDMIPNNRIPRLYTKMHRKKDSIKGIAERHFSMPWSQNRFCNFILYKEAFNSIDQADAAGIMHKG